MKHVVEIEDILPLTPCQRFFLGDSSYQEARKKNLLQYSYVIEGKIDAETAQAAWQAVVDAHPALRTSLHMVGVSQPFQVIHRKAVVRFAYEDMQELDEEARDGAVRLWQEKDALVPFDWCSPSLLRVMLHRVAERRYVLTLTVDHMIFDGWSLGLAIRDFVEACTMLCRSELPQLSVSPSVREYLLWQKRQDSQEALAWYKERLSGAPSQRLPFATPAAEPENVCARDLFFLHFTEEEDRQFTEGVKRLGVTQNVLFQGAWALLLARSQGDRQAYFLTSVTSRPSEVPDIHKVFNLLLGIVPYCVDCSGERQVSDWLDDLHAYQVKSLEYHHVPPREILGAQQGLPPLPLTSFLVFQNMDTGETEQDKAEEGLTIRADDAIGRSNSALVIAAFPSPRFHCSFLYDSTIIDTPSLERLADMLRRVMLELTVDAERTLDELWEKLDMDFCGMAEGVSCISTEEPCGVLQ